MCRVESRNKSMPLKIGITLPDLNNKFDPTFGDRVYNKLYTELFINQALVMRPRNISSDAQIGGY